MCIRDRYMGIVVLYTKAENIYAGIPPNSTVDSTDFNNANTSITIGAILSIVMLVLEILISFVGITLFFDRLNLFQSILHGLGAILYLWFVMEAWHYLNIWYLWIVFVLIPFIFEALFTFIAYLYHRKVAK
eukprot:TRINITY_DN5768_c0_g1_i6.p1 TRINITY_DN5768_c0_g1~~TRINITY_DN5768_c0_g1_i6.p1  ORF type:complete len:150 (+),score=25.05 TRINITY_DN5768_c0_g1_i6:60-452(+)